MQPPKLYTAVCHQRTANSTYWQAGGRRNKKFSIFIKPFVGIDS